MSTDLRARQPKGTPVGGQFAITARGESGVSLGTDGHASATTSCCQPLADGGQQCAEHTRERLLQAAADVQAAAAAGDQAALAEARTSWETAAAEHASTDEGHQRLSAQAAAARAAGDHDTHAVLATIVQRGEAMRAANQETAAVLRAVRLTQTDTPDLPAVPAVPALVSGPAVPDLTVQQRADWESVLREFDEWAPQIHAIPMYAGRPVPSDIVEWLPEVDAVLSNPGTSDTDLAQAIHAAGYYQGVRYAMPQWESRDDDSPGARSEAAVGESSSERAARWSEFSRRFGAAIDIQAARALDHPNAGTAAFAKYEEAGLGTSQDLTAHPNVPLGYLRDTIRSGRKVHDQGWEKARATRYDDNSLAMLLAAKDPDSFHRNEAFHQVMVAPFDTLTKQDRAWLAANLHQMPGSEENQRILAGSLASWARGYTDTGERESLGIALIRSDVEPVQNIGRDLYRGRTPEPEQKRKSWFR